MPASGPLSGMKIVEFAGVGAEVLVDGLNGVQRHLVTDLMPCAFGPSDLGA